MSDETSDLVLTYLRQYEPRSDVEALDVAQVLTRVHEGAPWDRSSALHLTASALIVHPPSRRVLLRWHDRQQAWLHVGGHADPAEHDPLIVALREGNEETSLSDLLPWPTAELQHVVIVPVPANAREAAHRHADLRFFFATQHPDHARSEHPTAAIRWLHVDDALALTSEDNVKDTIMRAARCLA